MTQDIINFQCPQCAGSLTLPAHMAGAKGPCLYCHTEIIGPIPHLSQPARLAAGATPAAPPSQPTPPAPSPAQAPQASEQPPVAQTPLDPFPSPDQARGASPPTTPPAASPGPDPASVFPDLPPLDLGAASLSEQGPAPPAAPRDDLFPAPPSPHTELPEPGSAQSRQQMPPAAQAPQAPVAPQSGPVPPAQQADAAFPSPPPAGTGAAIVREPRYSRSPGAGGKRSLALPIVALVALLSLILVGGLIFFKGFSGKETPAPPAPSEPSPAATPAQAATPKPVVPQPPPAVPTPEPAPPVAKPEPPAPEKPTNAATQPTPAVQPPPEPVIRKPELVATPEVIAAPEPVPTPEPLPTPAPAPPPPAAKPAASPPVESTPGPGNLLDQPITALQDFLNATTWQTRLNHSLYPEEVGPEMKAYYAERGDGPVQSTGLRYQHDEVDPETKNRFWVFHLTTEDLPEGFPVLIEQTDDGLRVDWETFVEFKDQHFREFSSSPRPGKRRFHLIMRNAHYFGKTFPELGDMSVYRLDPPIPEQEAFAFVRKDSLVNERIREHVDWGMNFTPYLEVEWTESRNGDDYLRITRLLHTNWRRPAVEVP